MKLARLLVLLGIVSMLLGCAPRLQEIGPAVDVPRLTDKAIHMPDGVDLPLRIWKPWDRPTSAVVLALHGFNDYSEGMAMPGHGLARRGLLVYAYDQRGFGRTPQRGVWPGEARLVEDLNIAVDLIKARHPELPLYILGESMGGSVAMVAVTGDNPPPVDGLILAAPAIWGWQTQSGLNSTLLHFAANTIPWAKVRPHGIRIKASNNRAALRKLSRDSLVIKSTRVDAAYGLVELMTNAYEAASKLGKPRFLVMFGDREGVLNRNAVSEALKEFPNLPPEQGRIALYTKGYHLLLRDIDQQIVFEDIAQWIAHPEKPLPSGADRPGL